MSQFVLYRVGRGRDADIQIGDTSVSRLHAELIMVRGGDGGYFLTDCASTGGTYREKDGKWEPVKQCFVELTDALRLGQRYQTSAKQLLSLVDRGKTRDR